MRTFHLERIEDESGVSGTGRVAEGVEFTDGSCTMRWLTLHRSTTVYASMADLVHIHGHGGKTKVVYEDLKAIEQISKPHLRLGFEGPDAEREAMSHGGGPALPGARYAYDKVKEIWAPVGWTASVGWTQDGKVNLRLVGPKLFLWSETKDEEDFAHFKQARAEFYISEEGGIESQMTWPHKKPEEVFAAVDGVRGKVEVSSFSNWNRKGVQESQKSAPSTMPPISDLDSFPSAPDRVVYPTTTSPCMCPSTDFKGGVCVKCGGSE